MFDGTLQYDSRGLITQSTAPNGLVTAYTYNPRSQVATVTDNLGQQMRYTYDAHQNLIRTETISTDGATALRAT
ncbi:MAG: hypothetical protein GKR94_29060 [Gammaproteobacteria bacterium]|nr:hypothetical protein [Gammaproteobacteria bacterium]